MNLRGWILLALTLLALAVRSAGEAPAPRVHPVPGVSGVQRAADPGRP